MRKYNRALTALLSILDVLTVARAQTVQTGERPVNPTTTKQSVQRGKDNDAAELARLKKERRAHAQALLLSLAADAGKFDDRALRARTRARIADVLWDADKERSRELFRQAWDAAEAADAEHIRLSQQANQQPIKEGNVPVIGGSDVRGEVLRLATQRDRALGEEFLAKLKSEKEREAANAGNNPRNPLNSSEAIGRRLSLARDLLSTNVERSLQIADPALGSVTMDGLDFLSDLRDKDADAADLRYGALLATAAASLQSDGNTVSLLSSYLFTPHFFVEFGPDGSHWANRAAGTTTPPNVAPGLRSAFFNVAAQILLRPQPGPEQEQTTSGIQGNYLIMKRLLPLFDQYAAKEVTDAIRAQMNSLSTGMSDDERQRDDAPVRQGIQPEEKSEAREQALLDRVDHARTSAEQDRLYLQLAMIRAENGDLKARDYIEKISDDEFRKAARAYIDTAIALQAINKKRADLALEITRTGELTHIQRVWILTQAVELLAKTDREKSLALVDEATAEAHRLDPSDPDRPRALVAIANALLLIDRSKAWDAVFDAVKAANSADGFTGEDGAIRNSLVTKGISRTNNNSVREFDISGIFSELAKENYHRTVDLASGFQREGPRA